MSEHTKEWDQHRPKLGAYGCVNVETKLGNDAERRHAELFERHAARQGPGYMNRRRTTLAGGRNR